MGFYIFGSLDEDKEPNQAGRLYNERYCDFNTDGKAWTVIQRRYPKRIVDKVDFNRTWSDYKLGFGELNREFWFGNEFIHKLTSEYDMEMKIVLLDSNFHFENYLHYSVFKVHSEKLNYKLTIGGYTNGTIEDIFLKRINLEFSTFDRRNGISTCPSSLGFGWWYKK